MDGDSRTIVPPAPPPPGASLWPGIVSGPACPFARNEPEPEILPASIIIIPAPSPPSLLAVLLPSPAPAPPPKKIV